MTGDLDLIIARALGSILKEYSVGEQILDAQADPWRDLLNSLGSFIPLVLGEKHPDWDEQGESVDRIRIARALKTKNLEAEISGICTLTSDQTLSPFYCRIRIEDSEDRIEKIQCKLGEAGEAGLIRISPISSKWLDPTQVVDETQITWAYEATLNKGQIPRTHFSLEESIVVSFRSTLKEHETGAVIQDYPIFLSSMEWFLPSILDEKYDHDICLDGFTVYKAVKTGDQEAEILGMSFLLPSGCVPYFLRLRIDRLEDKIELIEFKIGEMGEEGLIREYPYRRSNVLYTPAAAELDWAYEILWEKGETK